MVLQQQPASSRSRPFLLFLPFLLFYSALVVFFSKDELIIDEPSYLGYVSNLLDGYYSPPPPDIDLWHAPGYPLLITPFVAVGAPLLPIRLLNALFLYLAIVIFYRLMLKLVSPRLALYASIILGFYWLAWKGLPIIMTEPFVFCLITSIAYTAYSAFNERRFITRNVLLLSFLLGYLAITRFLFGYVILAGLIICLAAWIARRKLNYKKATLVFAFAFVVTLPWLFYTWSLTGRFLYWGNAGGTTIYWMSNPAEDEYGEWFNANLDPNQSIDGNVPDAKQRLEANHREETNELLQHVGVARDDLYKKKAWENIKRYPGKYAKNWVANVGRLLFNYPYSYRRLGIGTLLNMTPNLFLVAAIIFLFRPTMRLRKQIPFFIKFLLLVAGIYFAGSTFISATIRMFYILFPILAVWLFYVGSRTVQFNFPSKK